MGLTTEQQDFADFTDGSIERLNESFRLPTAPRIQTLPLTELNWKAFEQLCCRLIQRDPDIEGTPYLYGVQGNNQQGIDIVARKRVQDRLETWCYQCKNYKYFAPNELRSAIAALTYEADHYIILLASESQSSLRDIIDECGGQVELWDGQEISWKLKTHPDLVEDFFHPAWVEVFCGGQQQAAQSKGDYNRSAINKVPQPNATFVGRERELRKLRSQLSQQRLIIIEGIGGIGKTQLLLQALQSAQDISTIWLDVEGYETLENLKVACAQAIAQQNSVLAAGDMSWTSLPNQELRLVFDGLDRIAISQPDEIMDFLTEALALTTNLRLVITTQIELFSPDVDEFRLHMGPLAQDESTHLFEMGLKQQLDVLHVDGAAIGWLVRFCEGHPLSLRLVDGLIRYFKDIQVVTERLQSAGVRELKNPTRKKQNHSTSLQACLSIAYLALNHQQQRLLRYISNYPAGCMTIAAKEWQKTSDFQLDLAEIRRFFLVENRADALDINRLYMLSPIRQFIRNEWKIHAYEEATRIQMEVAEFLAMQAMVLLHMYLQSSSNIDDVAWGLARFDVELPNFSSALHYARLEVAYRKERNADSSPYLRIIAGLTTSLERYCFVRGLFSEGIAFAQLGIDAEETMGNNQQAAEHYLFLGTLQIRVDDQEGLEMTVRCLARLAELEKEPSIDAITEILRGEAARFRWEYEESVIHYEAAISSLRRLLAFEQPTVEQGEEQIQDNTHIISMLGATLSASGIVYEHLQRPLDALERHREALHHVLAIKDYINLGNCYHHIGNCQASLGDIQQALDAYKSALEIFLRLGEAEYISNSLCEIGRVVIETGLEDDLENYLTKDVLEGALEDVGDEVVRFIKMFPALGEPGAMRIGSILRKLYAIIELISLTRKATILEGWAQLFGQRTAALLQAEKPTASLSDHIDKAAFLYYLEGAINIALLTGNLASAPDQVTSEKCDELAQYCKELAAPRPFWTNPVLMLSSWLNAYMHLIGIQK